MPKISVIVPVYGVEDYIKKCIDSLVNQTFKDFEILVVNDGTKDRSIDIIKENFKDKRIIILDKENGGISDARNFGLKYASGEYIAFVDSDDYVHEEMLEKLYNCAIKNKSDIVECLSYKVDGDVIQPFEGNAYFKYDNIVRYIISRPSPWGKLIKKELMQEKEMAFLIGKIYEDLAVMPALALYTKKISFIDECLYYYVIHNGSIMTQSVYKQSMEDIFYSIDYLYKLFKTHDKNNEYQAELEYLYIVHLLHDASLRFIPFKEGIENILKISRIMKQKFPKWYKNKYYQKKNIKYKIICTLFYFNKTKLARLVLRKHLGKFK